MNLAWAGILVVLLLSTPQDAVLEAAKARVAAAREAVAREASEGSAREERLQQILRESTAKFPLRLTLGENQVVDQVRVEGFAGGRIKLAWPQGSADYPLETLPADLRTLLLSVLLSGATARDQFEVGRLFLRGGDYDRAERCFARALELDPALKPLIPDVPKLRALAHWFEGRFEVAGSRLQVAWNFRRAEEAKDFQALSGGIGAWPENGLELNGTRQAFAVVKDVPFRDRLRVSATPKDSVAGAHVLGLEFKRPDGSRSFLYGILSTKLHLFWAVREERGTATTLVPGVPCRPGARLELEFIRGRFSIRAGEAAKWSGNEGGFTEVRVLLGGLARFEIDDTEAVSLAFREAQVSGDVDLPWLTRRGAEHRDFLAGELARERLLRVDEQPRRPLALSIDALLDPAAGADYHWMIQALRRWLKSSATAEHEACRDALFVLTSKHPASAAGWYWRACFAEWNGEPREALRHAEQALQRLPDFPEALCLRARLLILAGNLSAPQGLVDRALALRPDLGEGHLLRGRLEFASGRTEAALASAALARQLAPEDAALQLRAQALLNVLRGPLWRKIQQAETPHYAVLSDLPAARCRQFADHLEAMRGFYEEALGLPSTAASRGQVLIFQAPEGFYQYMDTTGGGRSEATLGYFSPWYGQLVLFEDPEPAETMDTLGHEGFHHYLHGILGDAPPWFNEGMAEYVGAAKVEKGRIVEKVRLQEGRLLDLRLAMKHGWQPLSFERIMLEPKSGFYGTDSAFKYAQAWSMIHFFQHADQGRWKERLGAYVKRLQAGDRAEEAYAAVFAGPNLRMMEEAWAAYVKGLGAPPPPPAGAKAAAQASINLLRMLELKFDVVEGDWTLNSGKLESGAQPFSRVQFPYVPPEEYDLSISATRTDGADGLLIGLVHPGSQFVLVVDGFKGGTLGLGHLDGLYADSNETTKKRNSFKNGKPSSIVVRVRKEGVSVKVDGVDVLDWKGKFSRLSAWGDLRTPHPRALFIGANDSKFSITRVQLTPIGGEGQKLR